MKKIFLLIFPLVCFLNSCEEIVEGEALPYEEKLVVSGVLMPNIPPMLNITRTLPVLDEYDVERAKIKDAQVVLVIDNIEHSGTYLESNDSSQSPYGFYSAVDKIVEGKTYSLKINWKDKVAFSTMRIPIDPEIVSVRIDSVNRRLYDGSQRWEKIVKAQITPRANESYALTYQIKSTQGNGSFTNMNFGEVKNSDEITTSGLVEVNGDNSYWSSAVNLNSKNVRIYVYVHAFDSQFAEYFKSRYDNYTDVTFGEPTKVKWNVFGNAIGMFTGYSTAVDTLEF